MSDASETTSSDFVQMPLRICNTHEFEELVVFCKTCWIPVCVQCSREGHLEHECEGLGKVARDVRLQIPETCRQIEQDVIETMKMKLQNLKLQQAENDTQYANDMESLEQIKMKLIGQVKSFFERKRSECQARLNVLDNKLREHEKKLDQDISTIEQRIKHHEESISFYGNFDVIEMDTELKEMAKDYLSTGLVQMTYERMNMTSLKQELSEFMSSVTL